MLDLSWTQPVPSARYDLSDKHGLPDIENLASLGDAKGESQRAGRREAANHAAQTQEREYPTENKARPEDVPSGIRLASLLIDL